MSNFKEQIYRWLPAFLWCLLIFILSSLPTIETSEIFWWDFIIKKTAHVVEYGILYFLIFKAITNRKLKTQNSKLKATTQISKLNIISFLFCIFYGLTDEYHQSFVPGRTAAIRDIGFDAFGALAAFLRIRKTSSRTCFGI